MQRRDLFRMFATLAAIPFVAPIVAMCKPKAGMSEINDINRSLELMRHRRENKHEEMYRQALAEIIPSGKMECGGCLLVGCKECESLDRKVYFNGWDAKKVAKMLIDTIRGETSCSRT